MKQIPVTTVQTINLNPSQMADLFWSMDAIEQIRFFNELAIIAPRYDFEMQLQYIINPGEFSATDRSTNEAVRLLETIRDMMTQD